MRGGEGAPIPHLLTDHKITPLCSAQGAPCLPVLMGRHHRILHAGRGGELDWDAEHNCEDITQGRASASYEVIAADSRCAHVAQENKNCYPKNIYGQSRGISVHLIH